MVPTYDEAYDILCKYNKEAFHLEHGQTVAAIMKWYAQRIDPENVDLWEVVGLLHDVDFEMYPEEHCVKGEQILSSLGVDQKVIRSAMSHGYGMTATPYAPESTMEKVLFTIDELSGLIGAAVLVRPSRSVQDLEVKSLKKKFKQPSFAAGCSRETISEGAQMLGWDLDKVFSDTIEAMRMLETEGFKRQIDGN